jgi:ATP phosphoribosyltransferase
MQIMDYITIALPKGKLFAKSVDLLAKVGFAAENVVENSRKLVITNEATKVRFIIVKTMDLPVYVEYGAADIGIIGKDVLLKNKRDVYELLGYEIWQVPTDAGRAGSQKKREPD